jgi:hypothetical protein
MMSFWVISSIPFWLNIAFVAWLQSPVSCINTLLEGPRFHEQSVLHIVYRRRLDSLASSIKQLSPQRIGHLGDFLIGHLSNPVMDQVTG